MWFGLFWYLPHNCSCLMALQLVWLGIFPLFSVTDISGKTEMLWTNLSSSWCGLQFFGQASHPTPYKRKSYQMGGKKDFPANDLRHLSTRVHGILRSADPEDHCAWQMHARRRLDRTNRQEPVRINNHWAHPVGNEKNEFFSVKVTHYPGVLKFL